MSIATTSNKQLLLGNAVTTVFGFNFTVRQASDINVLFADASGNETDVTVNCVIALNAVAPGSQWAVGGTITYAPGGTPIAAGTMLVARRIMPYSQLTLFANQGGNFPAVTEQTADLLEMTLQQIVENLQRVPAISPGKDNSLYTLQLTPAPNAVLGWDATGKVLGTVANVSGVNLVLPGVAGIAVYTGAGATFTSRSIVAGDGTVTVTNGSGVAGNPSIIVTAKGIGSAQLGDSSVIARTLTLSALTTQMVNGQLNISQNGTVLTIALKTSAGTDPTPDDPVYVLFRGANTAPALSIQTITAAVSISTTVGGTFGAANNQPFRLWVVLFNDTAGPALRFGLVNCLTATAAGVVSAIFPLGQFPRISSTLIGAGSTSAGVVYTAGAAVSAKSYVVLGYLSYDSGLAVAGTFGVNQSRAHQHRQGDPLPGQRLQYVRSDVTAVVTGATALPFDDTIPQSGEGDQVASIAITPTSPCNVLKVKTRGSIGNDAGGTNNLTLALYQDAVANALAALWSQISATGTGTNIEIDYSAQALLSVSTTFKTRMGASGGGTNTFNGSAGARKYGGVSNGMIDVEEVVA